MIYLLLEDRDNTTRSALSPTGSYVLTEELAKKWVDDVKHTDANPPRRAYMVLNECTVV